MSQNPILLLGATGYTGQLTLDALLAKNLDVTVAGRSSERLQALETRVGRSLDRAVIDLQDEANLGALIGRHQVVINCIGPFLKWGYGVARLCAEAGVHYVDSTGEQAFIRDMYEKWHGRYQETGKVMVNAMAFEYALGDSLCAAMAEAVGDLKAVDILYRFDTPFTSRGTYLSMLAVREHPALAYVNGQYQAREVGSAVKRMHFPGQAKKSRGVWIPFGESVLVPRHVAVETVMTFMTLPKGNRDLSHMKAMEKQADGTPFGPDAAARADGTFGIMVEESRGHRMGVEGKDPYGVTAQLLVFAAQRLLSGQVSGAGVLTPAQAFGSAGVFGVLEGEGGARF